MFTLAVRTYDGLPNSVQAKCTSSPSSAILGKPLEREMSVLAITAGGPSWPPGCTRLTLIAPPSAVPESQHTRADPSFNNTTSALPMVSPSSTAMAPPKVPPASLEKATFTRGSSLAPVYQTTATRLPSTATDGPLTGQPLSSQLSENTFRGALQFPGCPFTNWISRTSLSERSR